MAQSPMIKAIEVLVFMMCLPKTKRYCLQYKPVFYPKRVYLIVTTLNFVVMWKAESVAMVQWNGRFMRGFAYWVRPCMGRDKTVLLVQGQTRNLSCDTGNF